MITVDMLDAVKIQFLKPIFEDDFIEMGMKALLIRIHWDEKVKCYRLFFDFTRFEKENESYFTESYYPNNKTGNSKGFFTAIEAGMYFPKYSVCFSLPEGSRNDKQFSEEIAKYLKVVE